MSKPATTNARRVAPAVWLLVQTGIYAIFVFLYYFLVLHFLGGWLKGLFDDKRTVYAVVALALMIGQGILLELLTGWLFTKVLRKGK